MSVLTSKGRNALSTSSFAIPSERKYPINDLPHARNALARVSQFGTPSEKNQVKRKVYSAWESLGKNKGK